MPFPFKSKTNMYLIVIPYFPLGAQGRELQMAIAGWRRHFQEDYKIVIVGEGLPKIADDDICCIESPRVPELDYMYRQHLDYVSCWKKVHEHFPNSKGMIFAADDNYLVQDIDIHCIKSLKYRSDKITTDMFCMGWKYDQYRTKELLLQEGLPIRNYTTHVPCWFDWNRLESVWERYDMEHNSYVIENLYFNIYHAGQPAIHCNEVKFQLCCPEDINQLEEQMKKKWWICNSPTGYTLEFEHRMCDYYGIYY